MKIKQFQDGGIFTTFTAVPYSTPPSTGQPQKSSAKEEVDPNEPKKGDLLEKDLLKALLGKGLPNEVNEFALAMEREMSGFTNSRSRSNIYRQMAKVNNIIYNKEALDKAVTEAEENNGLQEVAVSSDGRVYVKNEKGDLSKVSMTDLSKNPNKYQVLTNNDLNNLRRYDQSLTHNSDIIQTIQNSIGSDQVSKQIFEVVQKLGSESFKTNSLHTKEEIMSDLQVITGGNVKKPTNEQLKSLEFLAGNMGAIEESGGYLDVTTMTKSERNHIKQAFNYIWSTLPQNSRYTLMGRAAAEGKNVNDAGKLVYDALIFGSDYSEEREVKAYAPIKNPNAKTGSEATPKTNTQTQFERQLLVDSPQTYPMNFGGDFTWMVNGHYISDWVDKNDNPIKGNLIKDLVNGLSVAADRNSVSFGENIVNPIDFNKFAFGPVGGYVAYLPSKMVAGKIVPDYEKGEKISDVNEQIKPEMTDGEIRAILNKNGFDYLYYDRYKGTLKAVPGAEAYFQPFVIVPGYSGNNDLIKSNKYLDKVNSPTFFGKSGEEHSLVDLFYDNETKKNMFYRNFWSIDNIYKGDFAIHLNQDAMAQAAVLAGNGPEQLKQTTDEWLVRQRQFSQNSPYNANRAITGGNLLGY